MAEEPRCLAAGCVLLLGRCRVVAGPGLGEFYAHHAVLGTALINQLPALRGSRFHKTVTAPASTPYSVPTPGLLSCAVPGLGATRRLDGASHPRDGWVVVYACVCARACVWVCVHASLFICLSVRPSVCVCLRVVALD